MDPVNCCREEANQVMHLSDEDIAADHDARNSEAYLLNPTMK
jgi:hypothetical protein